MEETNALPGADAIVLPAGEYRGALIITDSITIDGAGAAATTVRGPPLAEGPDSVFDLTCNPPGFSVAISGLLITAGLNEGGGGVRNCGNTVSLRAVTMADNGGGGSSGGAIWNSGTLSVVDSAIVNNWAQQGGAILNTETGDTRIVNSTLSGNQAILGTGAVHSSSAKPVVMENVTLLETAPRPDGVGAIFGKMQLKNTLIANSGQGANCAGSVTSLGHNLSSDGSCNLNGPGDLGGVQPQLTGIQDNGGPTPTHGLYPSSPAIDAGDNNGCPPTDQRGVPRPQGAACEIGAYEYVPPPTQPPTPPPDTAPPPAATATPGLSLGPTPKATASPSPSPSVSAAAAAATSRRTKAATPFPNAPDADFVVEEESGAGSPWLTIGLGTIGVLVIAGGAAGGGYWYRRRRRMRLR